MGIITASVGDLAEPGLNKACRASIYGSIVRLSHCLAENDYRGHDAFDALSSLLLRPLTFDTKVLRTVLQQGVMRAFYWKRYSR